MINPSSDTYCRTPIVGSSAFPKSQRRSSRNACHCHGTSTLPTQDGNNRVHTPGWHSVDGLEGHSYIPHLWLLRLPTARLQNLQRYPPPQDAQKHDGKKKKGKHVSFSHRNGVALNTKHDARNTGQTSTRHTRRKQKKDTCQKDAARLKGQQQRGGNGIGRRLDATSRNCPQCCRGYRRQGRLPLREEAQQDHSGTPDIKRRSGKHTSNSSNFYPPVPPPIPHVTNTMSAPFTTSPETKQPSSQAAASEVGGWVMD